MKLAAITIVRVLIMRTLSGDEDACPRNDAPAVAAPETRSLARDPPVEARWFRRHSGLVRVTHWVNALCFIFLLMSGLQIFNAHPALYIGAQSDFDDPTISISARRRGATASGGETTLFGHAFDTTGVLGVSTRRTASSTPRAFPSWITLPSYQDLATGRRWHFFFAWLFVLNGLVYLALRLREPAISGATSCRRAAELAPFGSDDRRPCAPALPRGRGGEALQRAAEARLSRRRLRAAAAHGADRASPCRPASTPPSRGFSTSSAGARRRAPSISSRPRCSSLFVIVHLVMVLVSGVWNNIRSMITGRYASSAARRIACTAREHPASIGAASLARGSALGGLCCSRGCDRLSNEPHRRLASSSSAEALTDAGAALAPRRAPLAPRIQRGRHLAELSRQRLDRPAGRRLSRARGQRVSPTGGSRSAASSSSRCSSRSPICAPCRRARRSRGMTASRAGAASANGRACRSAASCRAPGSSRRRATSCSTAPTP